MATTEKHSLSKFAKTIKQKNDAEKYCRYVKIITINMKVLFLPIYSSGHNPYYYYIFRSLQNNLEWK